MGERMSERMQGRVGGVDEMDADIIAALNGLLEEERADAEALVGLVAMATDTMERQALTAMGGQAAQGCIDLHERLARLGAPISARVSHSVVRMLEHERFDDRLRAFGEVQRYLAGRCQALQARNLDDDTRALLVALSVVQMVHAEWAEQRADEFAASRPSDAESSSPSHAVPRGERPSVIPSGATGGPGDHALPGDVAVDATGVVDVSVARRPEREREEDDDGAAESLGALDESVTPAEAPEPDATDGGALNVGAPNATDSTATSETLMVPLPREPAPDAEDEAPAVAATKPRARRTRASTPPVGRRTLKKS